MSISVEILHKRHIDEIAPRLMDRHNGVAQAMQDSTGYVRMVEKVGPVAAFMVDGVVMAVAGLIDYTPSNRCFIWLAFAKDSGKHFVALLKVMRRTMAKFPRRRYEAYIEPGFSAGKRLAKIAGFEYEGLMRAFEGDGTDREMWAKICL